MIQWLRSKFCPNVPPDGFISFQDSEGRLFKTREAAEESTLQWRLFYLSLKHAPKLNASDTSRFIRSHYKEIKKIIEGGKV